MLHRSIDSETQIIASAKIDDEVTERSMVKPNRTLHVIWNVEYGVQALESDVRRFGADRRKVRQRVEVQRRSRDSNSSQDTVHSQLKQQPLWLSILTADCLVKNSEVHTVQALLRHRIRACATQNLL